MTVPMPDPYRPGSALPHPLDATGSTAWAAPAQDYAGRPDGAAPWADADPPAAVPPAIDPPALRVWAPSGEGPAPAA